MNNNWGWHTADLCDLCPSGQRPGVHSIAAIFFHLLDCQQWQKVQKIQNGRHPQCHVDQIAELDPEIRVWSVSSIGGRNGGRRRGGWSEPIFIIHYKAEKGNDTPTNVPATTCVGLSMTFLLCGCKRLMSHSESDPAWIHLWSNHGAQSKGSGRVQKHWFQTFQMICDTNVCWQEICMKKRNFT